MTDNVRVAGLGGRIIRQWTSVVIRYARTTVVATLLLAVLCIAYAAGNLGISTNTEDMISNELEWRKDFIALREQFPQLYRVLVIVVDAQTEALAQAAVADLDNRLSDSHNLVHSQYSATVDAPLAGRELLLLSEDELFNLADDIAVAQPLIGRLQQNYSIAEFFNLLTAAYKDDPAAVSPAFLSQLNTVLQSAENDTGNLLDWSRLAGNNSQPSRRLLLVKPVLDTDQPRPAQRVLDAIRDIGRQTSDSFDNRVQVRLSGLIAMEDEELVSASKNAGVTGGLALVSVLLILFIAFRSWRLLLISLATLVTGLAATAAFAAVAFDKLNVISIAFAVLYIGLGIDLVIHYLLRLRECLASNTDIHAALLDTSEQIGGALIICALTTAAGFYAFTPTDFVGVSQLGLISGTGMFISLIVSITLLPALVCLSFPHGMPTNSTSAYWQAGAALSWLLKAPRVIIGLVLLAVCGAVFNLTDLRFEKDPLLLRDPNTESVQTFKDLSADPTTAVRSISVLANANTDIKTLSANLEAQPSVQRVVTLSSFEFTNIDTQLSLLDEISLLMGDNLADFPALQNIEIDSFNTAVQQLTDAIDSADLSVAANPDTHADLLRFLLQLQSQLTPLNATSKQLAIERLQLAVLGDLPAAMQLLASRLAPKTASEYPQDFRQRWVSDEGQQLLQVIPAMDVSVPKHARQFVQEVLELAPSATGVPVVYERSGETIYSAFRIAFITAFVVISIFLFVLLKQKKNVLLVLVPLGASAILLAGAMLLFNIPFNYANIIALPLLLGISVDTGIHLVHRAEQAPEKESESKHGNNLEAHRKLLTTSTARAILFSSVTTLASFGNLAISSHLGMASMGQLLTVGLIINVSIMLLLLPAMLTLRVR